MDREQAQYNHSVTGKLLAITLLILVVGAFVFGGFWWLNDEFGRLGPVMGVIVLLLAALPVVYMMIGVAASGRAQENMGKTVASVAQLTKAQQPKAGPVDYEAKAKAKADEYAARMQFENWQRQQERDDAVWQVEQKQRPLLEDQQAREQFIKALGTDPDTVDGELYVIR